MVNFYECHFIYNGINSRDYDLIIANIETERFRPISGSKKGVFLFNRNSKANELMGDDYKDSPLTIDIEILTCHGRPLPLEIIKEVERWLFTNSIYRRMYIDTADDPYGETYEMIGGIQKRLYFNCRFLDAEKIESHGGVIGFKCRMETDSMMMWQDEITHILDFKDPIIYDDGGVEKKLLLGDVNMDGVLTADDAQMAIIVATKLLSHPSGASSWEELHEIVDEEFDEPLTDLQLMVCDMDYTPTDYLNHAVPQIYLDDPQRIMNEYVADLVYFPSKKTEIHIVDGQPVVIVYDNIRVPEIEIDSDIDGFTYPVMKIFTGRTNNGTIRIFNTNDPFVTSTAGTVRRETVFTNVPANTSFTIDSTINYVSEAVIANSGGGSVNMYQHMTGKFFPRFVEGINKLEIYGDISAIEVTWQNRRFL